MESAALTKAHDHVRTAATATYDKRVATAGQEHDFAATAFQEAVHDTHNAEVGTGRSPSSMSSNSCIGSPNPQSPRGPPPQARWADQRSPAQGEAEQHHDSGSRLSFQDQSCQRRYQQERIPLDNLADPSDLSSQTPAVLHRQQPRRKARHSNRQEDYRWDCSKCRRCYRGPRGTRCYASARSTRTAVTESRVGQAKRVSEAAKVVPDIPACFSTNRGQLSSILLSIWGRHIRYISTSSVYIPTSKPHTCSTC
jgi:hypothetical protein